MPAPSWENLDEFFDLDTNGGFAFPAVIVSQKGWTRQINAIFDDPYFNSQIGEYELDATQPRITAKEADLADVLKGDTVTIAGQTYDAERSPEPDGTGMAVLRLATQNAELRY